MKAEEYFAIGEEERTPAQQDEFLKENFGLVYRVLHKLNQGFNQDLFQEGCLALYKASSKYNPEKSVKFSTYATFLIEKHILNQFQTKQNKQQEQTESYEALLEANAALEDFINDEEYVDMEYLDKEVVQASLIEYSKKLQKLEVQVDKMRWMMHLEQSLYAKMFNEYVPTISSLAEMFETSAATIRNLQAEFTKVLMEKGMSKMEVSYEELLERLRGDKKIPDTVICLDPGKTTGVAVFEKGHFIEGFQIENCYDEEEQLNMLALKDLFELFQGIAPDVIVMEDYRIYKNKTQQHSNSRVPVVKLIGAIESYVTMDGDIQLVYQMASQVKSFITETKLQSWGIKQKVKRHSADAARHGLYYFLFHKKGRDLV